MKKRETGTVPLEMGADADFQETEKEDIVDDIVPAASSTLSK